MMYLDNDKFYNQLMDWYSKPDGTVMPNEIAIAIMKICKNLAKSGRFAGYSWREDMVQEAILMCVRGARKFDPKKSSNPFSYFTQIAYNSFRKFLNDEHKHLATIEYYKQNAAPDHGIEINDEDESYNFIIDNAKRKDTVYQKHYEIKKKRASPVSRIMDSCFED